jgi:hypothetical protein
MTRGMRNNNPGNIRLSADKFRGEIPSKDTAFKQFSTMEYGYRALIVTLQTYQSKHGCGTIRKMISRWAPDNENNTSAYMKHVSASTGYGLDEAIDMRKKDVAVKIARAISDVENAGWHDTSAAMRGFDMIG